MPEQLTWGQVLQGVEEAEPRSYEPVPTGRYVAHIEDVSAYTSSGGNNGINLKFRITEGEFANRVVYATWWKTASSEAALRITRTNFNALGLSGLLASGPTDEQIFDAIRDQSVEIYVKQDVYNERVKHNVSINKSNGKVTNSSASGLPAGGGLPSSPNSFAQSGPTGVAQTGLPTNNSRDPWATSDQQASGTVYPTPPSGSPF